MRTRIEGAKAITLDNLDVALEKIYQKSYGLRHEVRLDKDISLENAQALLHGGVPYMEIVQGFGNLIRMYNESNDQTRGLMDHIYEMNKLVKANTEAIYRILDKDNP